MVGLLVICGWTSGAVLLALSISGAEMLQTVQGRGSGWVLVASPQGLPEKERDDLANQPWVLGVWPLETARFHLWASLGFGASQYGTELFLDSLPREALDLQGQNWTWSPGDPVPLLVSREFLTLYNYGFAPARGLPALHEKNLADVPLTFRVSGALGSWELPAKIVGFTDRWATLLAPVEFIRRGNLELAGLPGETPKRAAVGLRDPGQPEFSRWINDRGWTVAGEGLRSSTFVQTASVVLLLVGGLGIVVLLLAFGLAALGLKLTLEKSRKDLRLLLVFGAEPKDLGFWVTVMQSKGALIGLGVYAGVLVLASQILAPLLSTLNIPPAGIGIGMGAGIFPVGLGIEFLLVTAGLNRLITERNLLPS